MTSVIYRLEDWVYIPYNWLRYKISPKWYVNIRGFKVLLHNYKGDTMTTVYFNLGTKQFNIKAKKVDFMADGMVSIICVDDVVIKTHCSNCIIMEEVEVCPKK